MPKEKNKILLSIVIPTLGRKELLETLEQLLTIPLSPDEFEVIIGGNGPESFRFMDSARQLYSSSFRHINVQKFEDYLATAEENALRTVKLAKGKHVWILGDDDLILREGLISISNYSQGDQAGVFFTYKQMTSSAILLPNPPIFSTGRNREISFTDLVARLGIQSIPTGFGRFLIRRDLINYEEWDFIIKSTGELFSHVLAFAAFTRHLTITWEKTPIIVYRQSSYHEGSDSTWRKYGRFKEQPWITPFCGQLAGQIKFLVEYDLWTAHQAEFALFNERENTFYQADYLLQQIGKQLREAILNGNENLRRTDLDNLGWYFMNIASSRLPIFRMFKDLSEAINSDLEHRSKLLLELDKIENSFPLNSPDGLFSAGISFWADGYPVFGLPYGYVQIKSSIPDRPLVMRIFDLDSIREGSNFRFFTNVNEVSLHKSNYNDIFTNSKNFESRGSWNINDKLIEYYSIPKIYSFPSLYFMKTCRRIPVKLRNVLKRLIRWRFKHQY